MRLLFALVAITSLLLGAHALAQGQRQSGQGGGEGRSAVAQSSGSHGMSQQDKQWLDYAATDNQGEIQESLLAEKKAQSLALKAFVRLMVDDHVHVESELAALVNGQHVDAPTGPGKKAEKTMSEMQNLHGNAFDHAYIKEQIKDHKDDIRKYSEEARTTKNADVRRYAIESLPTLEQHLALAEAVQGSLPREGGQQVSSSTSR